MGDMVSQELLGLTARIVAAHIGYNQVSADALPSMIEAVYRSLALVRAPEKKQPLAAPKPAVAVKQSVFPDFIICLENGKKLKMLKRHLKIYFGMTPADYRAKWGLPPDYPMVAPNYAMIRSGWAKSIGLGRKARADVGKADASRLGEPGITVLPSRRARGLRR